MKSMKAMKTNPVCILASEEVMGGRDKLIAKLWARLDQKSIILSGEKGIGKTSIIRNMKAEGKENALIISQNLKAVRSPSEFVEGICKNVEKYSSNKRIIRQFRDSWNDLEECNLKIFKFRKRASPPHWKTVLIETIKDLVTNQDRQIIFLWDEVPYMLYNMEDKDSMEILDTLQSLRQNHPQLRMVFTGGSISIHHVIKRLQQFGYHGTPINDMDIINVPALSLKDATDLITRLIEGEKIETDDIEKISEYIAKSVSCIPFYIHLLISELKFIDGLIDKKTVAETINKSLSDPLNIWKMEYYRDKLDNYYTEEDKKLALKILDILSCEDGLSFDDLCSKLGSGSNILDEEKVRSVLTLLRKDYYLVREDKIFKFSRDIIKKYWYISRKL